MGVIKLKERILGCTDCQLHKVGRGPVPFRGVKSKIMVVGEAPGRREDEKGRPFCGPAGVKLWNELETVGIDKREIFTTNAVCCFPERTPTDDEVYACRANLHAQMLFCDPHWILALGRVANFSLGLRQPLGKVHGEWYEQRLSYHPARSIQVFPTYHPAAVLRNKALTGVWRDDLAAFAKVVHAEEEEA